MEKKMKKTDGLTKKERKIFIATFSFPPATSTKKKSRKNGSL